MLSSEPEFSDRAEYILCVLVGFVSAFDRREGAFWEFVFPFPPPLPFETEAGEPCKVETTGFAPRKGF